MTDEEVVAVVTMLVEAYPRDVKKETFRAYVSHLAHLPRDLTLKVVQNLINTSKWLPSIAEIMQLIAREQLPDIPSIDVAWDEAVRLMSRIGSYGSLGDRGTPYVNRTLRLCGRWADVCQEDMTWLRKRFEEIYENITNEAVYTMQTEQRPPAWLPLPAPSAPPQIASDLRRLA